MKKLLSLLLVAGVVTLISCGPSAKEKEAKEKAKQDSIAMVEKEKKMQDSIAMVEKQKRMQDSIAMVEKQKKIQDSLAALKTKKVSKKAPVKKDNTKKVGGGRRS